MKVWAMLFWFMVYISAFGNSVTNAGNTNARIANPRELDKISGKALNKYIEGLFNTSDGTYTLIDYIKGQIKDE